MNPITTARIGIATVAAFLLGYGIRADNNALRWAGIGFLVAALLLRFVGPRENRE